MSINKRFIAGAICPKCELIDKIVVFSVAGKQFAECVHCHFRHEAKDDKMEESKKSADQKIIWLKAEK